MTSEKREPEETEKHRHEKEKVWRAFAAVHGLGAKGVLGGAFGLGACVDAGFGELFAEAAVLFKGGALFVELCDEGLNGAGDVGELHLGFAGGGAADFGAEFVVVFVYGSAEVGGVELGVEAAGVVMPLSSPDCSQR